MSTKRPTAVAVRTLTAEDVAKVMQKFGYFFSSAEWGTARAVADALNNRLLTRTEEPTK